MLKLEYQYIKTLIKINRFTQVYGLIFIKLSFKEINVYFLTKKNQKLIVKAEILYSI